MALILYLPKEIEPESSLPEIIKTAIPDCRIIMCHSIGELSEWLHRPLCDVSVAVLYVGTRAELMEIIYLGDILKELRVVLVLPDSDQEVLERAYILCPRFIASAESDFKHLGGVLKRMVSLYDKVYEVQKRE